MSTMRTLGRPSSSTVARDMAVGSRGSLRLASSNQATNSRKGSSASVKSLLVNPARCSIGADSDILRSIRVAASAPSSLFQQPRYRGTSGSWPVAMRRLQARAWVLALALMGGGCSVSYQLDSVLANKDAGAAAEAYAPRAAAPKASAEMPAETDPRHRPRCRERGFDQGRQAQQRALGESEDRGARHRYTPRLGLQSPSH